MNFLGFFVFFFFLILVCLLYLVGINLQASNFLFSNPSREVTGDGRREWEFRYFTVDETSILRRPGRSLISFFCLSCIRFSRAGASFIFPTFCECDFCLVWLHFLLQTLYSTLHICSLVRGVVQPD